MSGERESNSSFLINISFISQYFFITQIMSISIRYIDFGQVIGFDRNFQSNFKYNCMKC